jgi:ABC-type lipoprotein release transport system permease subunit
MSALAFAARSMIRQPGRAMLGVAGIAATGALLFDMLLLSRGLVVSMEDLLENVGFDVRVMATESAPMAGPPIERAGETVAAIAALPEVEEVVPLRMGTAEVDLGGSGQRAAVDFIGTTVAVRRPWTLVRGGDLDAASPGGTPVLVVNRAMAAELQLSPGADVALRGTCVEGSSMPPTPFRVGGIVDFPFDQALQFTAATTLRDFARACGDESRDEADMLMVASRSEGGAGGAAQAIRRIRPDLQSWTNEELVARFQQVEFSYFRQISVVLASITLFFGVLLITVLLSVSTNQRLGEIAALRALGFSQSRMVADVLWRSALLVGTGGILALPLGLALSTWLDAILRTMPGIPMNLHFFVFEARALILYVVFLALTAILAAIYPIHMVARLPIAATLRNEVVS